MDVKVTRTGDWDLAQRISQACARDVKAALRAAIRLEAEDCRSAMVEGIIAGAPGGQKFKPLAASTLAFRRAAAAGRQLAAGRRKTASLKTAYREKEAALTGARRAGMYVSRKKFGTAASRYGKLQKAIGRAKLSTSNRVLGQAARGGIGTKPLIQHGDLLGSIRAVHKGDVSFIGILRTAKTKDGKSLFNVARSHEFGAGPKAVKMSPKQRRFLMAMFRTIGTAPKVGKGGGGVLTIRIPPRPFVAPVFKALFGNQKAVGERIKGRLLALLPLSSKP